jgi:hypothetical protein
MRVLYDLYFPIDGCCLAKRYDARQEEQSKKAADSDNKYRPRPEVEPAIYHDSQVDIQ